MTYGYRPLDVELARAILVGVTPQQRAWLGGASGDQHELDAADAAAENLLCRVLGRAAATPECRQTCQDAPAFVRGTLPRRNRAAVAAHVGGCAECAWMVDQLPRVADTVGAIASVYGDSVIGPPESSDPARRGRARLARRPAIAVAAAAVLGLGGVGVAAAQGGWLAPGGSPAVVEPVPEPTRADTERVTLESPAATSTPSDAASNPAATEEPSPTPDDAATGGTVLLPGTNRPATGGVTRPGTTTQGGSGATGSGSTTPGTTTPGTTTPGTTTPGTTPGTTTPPSTTTPPTVLPTPTPPTTQPPTKPTPTEPTPTEPTPTQPPTTTPEEPAPTPESPAPESPAA